MDLLKQNHLDKHRVDIVSHWQPTIDVYNIDSTISDEDENEICPTGNAIYI